MSLTAIPDTSPITQARSILPQKAPKPGEATSAKTQLEGLKGQINNLRSGEGNESKNTAGLGGPTVPTIAKPTEESAKQQVQASTPPKQPEPASTTTESSGDKGDKKVEGKKETEDSSKVQDKITEMFLKMMEQFMQKMMEQMSKESEKADKPEDKQKEETPKSSGGGGGGPQAGGAGDQKMQQMLDKMLAEIDKLVEALGPKETEASKPDNTKPDNKPDNTKPIENNGTNNADPSSQGNKPVTGADVPSGIDMSSSSTDAAASGSPMLKVAVK
jgi:hypothetical protein